MRVAAWAQPAPRIPQQKLPRRWSERHGSRYEDQAVVHISHSDGSSLPPAGPLGRLGDWRSVASSIYHVAARMSGFSPGAVAPDPEAWGSVRGKLASAPFFTGFSMARRSARISPSSLKPAVDAALDLASPLLSAPVAGALVAGLKKIGEFARTNGGADAKATYCQVGLVVVREGKVHLAFLRAVVMLAKQSCGYQPIDQELKIDAGHGALDHVKCMRGAEQLIRANPQRVDDWQQQASAAAFPPMDNPAWGA